MKQRLIGIVLAGLVLVPGGLGWTATKKELTPAEIAAAAVSKVESALTDGKAILAAAQKAADQAAEKVRNAQAEMKALEASGDRKKIAEATALLRLAMREAQEAASRLMLQTAYSGGSAPVSLPAGFTVSNVVHALDGLVPGATYHWRVIATNSLGVAISPDQILSVPALYASGDLNGDDVVDSAELNVVLARYWPTSPWLQITKVVGLGGTNVNFSLTNDLAGAFSVEFSTNLTDWQRLGPATPRYEYTDTNAPVLPQGFYRLCWP